MRVKICGIRQEEALEAAVGGGADMVGFLHYPASPRHVAVQEAERLRALLPERVQAVVRASGVVDGRCVLFVPHTTAGLTINENDDPDVPRDMLTGLADLLGDESRFRHYEGNAGGHLLSSLLGVSLTIFIAEGKLALGRWQAIYFGEFDGPRQREVWVRIVNEG